MNIGTVSSFTTDEVINETINVAGLSKKKSGILLLIVLALTILLTAFSIYRINNGVSKKERFDLIFILVCCGIMCLILLWFRFVFPNSLKKQFYKNYGTDGITYKYIFHVNSFDVSSFMDGKKVSSTINYNMCKKVIERKDLILIFPGKNNFFMVRKEDLNPSDMEKIKNSIKNIVKKYKEK